MLNPISSALSCLAFYLPLLLILPVAWVIRYTSGKVHETFEDPSDIIQEIRLRSRMQKWFLVFALVLCALLLIIVQFPRSFSNSTVGSSLNIFGICLMLPGLCIILYCASDLLRCPQCQQKLELWPNLKFCPHCGAQLAPDDTR